MGFQDLTEILDPFLPLPIRGKTYRIPAPSVAVGLRSQATLVIGLKVKAGEEVSPADVAALQLDDEQEAEFTHQMLGDLRDEMAADGVPWEYVRHAAKTVFMWTVGDREQAEKVWADAGKAPRPAPRDRKAPAKKRAPAKKTTSSRSSSTSRRTPASPGPRS